MNAIKEQSAENWNVLRQILSNVRQAWSDETYRYFEARLLSELEKEHNMQQRAYAELEEAIRIAKSALTESR